MESNLIPMLVNIRTTRTVLTKVTSNQQGSNRISSSRIRARDFISGRVGASMRGLSGLLWSRRVSLVRDWSIRVHIIGGEVPDVLSIRLLNSRQQNPSL